LADSQSFAESTQLLFCFSHIGDNDTIVMMMKIMYFRDSFHSGETSFFSVTKEESTPDLMDTVYNLVSIWHRSRMFEFSMF
jgi:hypothetical protein